MLHPDSNEPAGLRIRTADATDAAVLAQVELRTALAAYADIFPDSMAKPTLAQLEERWDSFLADPDQTTLIAERSEGPAGFVIFGSGATEMLADCRLRKLYVVPEQARRGIGSTLHDRAVFDLRAAGHTRVALTVLERNIVARRMYEHRGWKLLPRTHNPWPGSGILELGYVLELGLTRL